MFGVKVSDDVNQYCVTDQLRIQDSVYQTQLESCIHTGTPLQFQGLVHSDSSQIGNTLLSSVVPGMKKQRVIIK